MILKIFIFAFIFALSFDVFAFPEMIRHGYFNCVICHVSPNGGGVITTYGRQLSRDALSTFGAEGEEAFAYGYAKLPEWLSASGDLRALQYYADSLNSRDAKAFIMQDDVEAAANYKNIYFDASIGQQQNPQGPPAPNSFFSRRHFVNYRPTENVSFRVGKFRHEYGINTADHIISIKRGLGWNENTETYNAEAAWLGEKENIFITAILGRPDSVDLNREKGIAVTASYFFSEKMKVGLSCLNSTNNSYTRQVAGPFAILGFSQHLFLLTEMDLQFKNSSQSVYTSGLVSYNKLSYEYIQGLHFFLTQEYSQLNLQSALSITKNYGLGIQFFPRPHLEILLTFLKQQIASVSNEFYDYDYLMFHFYL